MMLCDICFHAHEHEVHVFGVDVLVCEKWESNIHVVDGRFQNSRGQFLQSLLERNSTNTDCSCAASLQHFSGFMRFKCCAYVGDVQCGRVKDLDEHA